MQGFPHNSLASPPGVASGQAVPPTGGGGWGQDAGPGVNGTPFAAATANDMLGNMLRICQAAGITPTPNRLDDLLDALNELFKGVNADWNAKSGLAQILNKPASLSVMPTLMIELGHSAQQNGARGIDKGGYYQIDFHAGTTAYNGFQYVANSDGTLTLPQGQYMINGSVNVIAPSTDTFQLPAQVALAIGTVYKWPGIFQYAVRAFPSLPIASQSVSGSLGSIVISGVQAWDSNWELWLGFSKVLGSVNQTPLLLQGVVSITQLSATPPGTALAADTARAPV
ncbi:hypothetical protein G3O06_20435 [Burkholderia sp. Ac-20345]|uniref:hypothetical protein n=1 Tax=Burkholderia sp. Ac-20345 TaxID=2703891 RepID=UPI00197BF774|nr:hypothetical protein [Burkholderia sp. Ac-20345]MBN3779907.1 hypothetical protein [Burkholderia sp. Ac-20345]